MNTHTAPAAAAVSWFGFTEQNKLKINGINTHCASAGVHQCVCVCVCVCLGASDCACVHAVLLFVCLCAYADVCVCVCVYVVCVCVCVCVCHPPLSVFPRASGMNGRCVRASLELKVDLHYSTPHGNKQQPFKRRRTLRWPILKRLLLLLLARHSAGTPLNEVGVERLSGRRSRSRWKRLFWPFCHRLLE